MDFEEIKADKVIDTRGLTPPMPLLKTRKALGAMKPGKILEIWCLDPETKKDLPSLHDENGDTYLGCSPDPDGYLRFFIRKGSD